MSYPSDQSKKKEASPFKESPGLTKPHHYRETIDLTKLNRDHAKRAMDEIRSIK